MASDTTTSLLTGYSYYSTAGDADYSSISGSINFTGIGSGTDFTSIVEQLVEIESIQKQRLESWKETWEAKVESMLALNERLLAISEAAEAMDTEAEFLETAAASSDNSVATASPSSTAATGAYTITVGEDVKHIISGTGVSSATADVVTGSGGEMELFIGGSLVTIMVGSAYSITDIADAINTKVAGVASVEDDGTGSRSYHLQLVSTVGGTDGAIVVTKNPTDLSFDSKDMALKDDTGWGVTGNDGPEISLAGQFFGDKTTSSLYDYVFTVSSGGSSVGVGSDDFELIYQVLDENGTTIVGATTISLSSTYSPGDSIEIDNGMYIQLGTGTVEDGDSFTVRAYANDVDDAELVKWSGSTITTGGNYLGSTSRTYSFTVVGAGTLDDAGTAGTVILRWTDSGGDTGTVTLTQSNTAYEVEQGVTISLAEGAVSSGDTFQINVFAADEQQGQDRGLAQVCKVVHDGFSDSEVTSLTDTAATFTYIYNGEQITIDVAKGSTLYQLVALINDDTDNPGVTASILNDGKGLPDSYKLVLTGQDTGASHQITCVTHTFTGSAFSNGGELGGGFTVSQKATNAMIKVDGYPYENGEYLQRASNSISDVLAGVSLSLHDAGETVITISYDTDGIYGKIEALINAINYAQEYIRTETYYDANDEDTGVMIGNYSYYLLKSRIDTALNTRVSGLLDGIDSFIQVGQIGIETDPDDDGNWVIDEETLMNALETDMDGVMNLFIHNDSSDVSGVARRIYEEMELMTDSDEGILNVIIDNYNGIIENLEKKIDQEEDRIALYEDRQLLRFARLETALTELETLGSTVTSYVDSLPSTSG